jgi:hypothetical protein
MRQCDLNKVIAGSTTGRAEVMAAIAGLAEEVTRLALHFKLTAAIACAAEAERAAEALRAATGRATETVEQAELKATSAATVCDVQAVEMAEASNYPLSPQQDSCTGNISSEIHLIDELNAKLEAALAEPKDASCREENAIAARVAELHDRLGGFIKPFATAV